MEITRIVEDDWSDSGNQSREYSSDSLDAVLTAVGSLNGQNKTLVIFQGDEDVSLMVGGGNDGRYVVQIAKGIDRKFYTLCRSAGQDQEMLEVVSGGQSGMYPAKQCVDLKTALRACGHFAQTGQPSPDLSWEVEG